MNSNLSVNSLDVLIEKIKNIITNEKQISIYELKDTQLEEMGEIFEIYGPNMLEVFLRNKERKEEKKSQLYKFIREKILPLLKNDPNINKQREIGRYLIKSLNKIL